MEDITLPDYFDPETPKLYDVVGIIPATDKTPDIHYSDDTGSEKVAFLTFLTFWFLDAHIQAIVKTRSPSVICGFSPLSGGARLEEIFRRPQQTKAMTSIVTQFNLRSPNGGYEGRSSQPIWSTVTDEIISPGWMAVYAMSSMQDEKEQHTAEQKYNLCDQFSGLQVAEEDAKYKAVSDSVFTGGITALCEVIQNHPEDLDHYMSQLLHDGFWSVDDLFDMVPAIATHEVTHMLQHNTNIRPTVAITQEAMNKIKLKSPLNYFRQPWEAVAELGGISLLNDVQRNAGLNYGLPTSGLDLILPNSYADIECALQTLKTNAQFKREP